ncbi:MAG TPA: DNRLRE domain-containing protein, partial [Actinomycetota bacterium]|nr:DNRLRE domain-containing protein [Actinomycetota bacterium]
FDVSGIGASVETARLRLYTVDGSDRGGDVYRALGDTWGESTVSWATAPPAAPTPLASLTPVKKATWYEVDVTSVVTGDGPVSFRIVGTSADSAGYASREAGTATAAQLVVTASPTPDTEAPLVSITSPSDGADVAGRVDVTVEASDDRGVASVDLLVDGQLFGTDSSAPYSFRWDTSTATLGPHTLQAIARDAVPNEGSSAIVTVNVVPAPPAPTSFTFAAAGDLAMSARTDASLASLDASPAEFFLALGDLEYDAQSPDSAWCDYVTSHLPTKGPTFPFELISGNHEQQGAADGYILEFAACLPDRLGAVVEPGSTYGADYYIDYPAAAPLMRVISIVPNLTVADTTYSFDPGSPHRDWLIEAIRSARADGIPWVAVGLHYHCLTTGDRTNCPMGDSLWNLLLSEGVDLILNGHEHNYQRSKQLKLDPLACPSMTPGIYVAGCIVDDGTDGIYPKGTGTTNVVVGSFGQSLYRVSPDDSEAPYFSRIDGATWGYLELEVTADRIDARFVNTTGAFTDAFSIVAGATADADLVPPTAPDGLSATATSVTTSDLAWSPSTDGSGIDHYSIYRDGAALGQSPGTTFTDTTATPGATHTYTVRAYDPAGNPSDASVPASVTMPSAGPQVTLLSAADATLVQTYPNATRGTYTNLQANAGPVKDFLIRFDVAGIGAAGVARATLRLYCIDASDLGGSFRSVSPAWDEPTVTWNTAPSATGDIIATLGKVVSGSWYEVDVTSAVTGDGPVAFRVSTSSTNGSGFSSRDGTAGFVPQLVVTPAS